MIKAHNAECIKTLKDVASRLSGPERKSYPQRYAHHLWHSLGNSTIPPEFLDRQGNNHAIRQIHDYYGWKAWSGRCGHCAGALYRTKGFIDIPEHLRDGSNGTGRNIHIEHTVPVAVLIKHLVFIITELETPKALLDRLVRLSICTAFSHYEQKSISLAGATSFTNEAFAANGATSHEFPFRRYLPLRRHLGDFCIFNVVTGAEVDLEYFTFNDHLKTMIALEAKVTNDATGVLNIYGV
jgi:hypothetical protein